MKILVIGGGGREHALAWKAAQSPLADKVFVAPGNAGTALEPNLENVAIGVNDIPALVSFAKDNDIGLTIVGPEAPLVAGVVDAFTAAGLKCFGPTQGAAQLEGSKSFKDFLARHRYRPANTRPSPRSNRRWSTCRKKAPRSSSRPTAWQPARA